jgi:dynein light chain roadblock-type
MATPMSIPTSASNANKPGPHATISPDALINKPHLHSPPRPQSPMPPTASLTDAGTTLLAEEEEDGDEVETGEPITKVTSNSQNSGPSNSSSLEGNIKSESHQASSSLPIPSPPAEVEATLTKLTSHANVAGVLVLSRPEALVIRSGGSFFDPSGPGARDRAIRLKSVVEMVRNTILGLERDVPKSEIGDELSFLRIRTKKYEMMISPSDKYLLVVIQDPTVSS